MSIQSLFVRLVFKTKTLKERNKWEAVLKMLTPSALDQITEFLSNLFILHNLHQYLNLNANIFGKLLIKGILPSKLIEIEYKCKWNEGECKQSFFKATPSTYSFYFSYLEARHEKPQTHILQIYRWGMETKLFYCFRHKDFC